MKRILLLLFVFGWSLFYSVETKASHGMGGELTWTCLANGQFKFRLKFYRDCSGIPAPASVNLTTTVPGVPTIAMPRVQINDISPTGLISAGNAGCPACATGTPNIGLVEEDVYESAPITLNGTPPAAGWQFYWGECCRSGSINNITNPGTIGFRIRAIMYPYNPTGVAQNTNPCFDSSPYFAERPSTIICTGYPFKYNPNAIDPELDSLRYEWGAPLTDTGTPVAWAPGYNQNSQLPSVTQNPNNIAATVNPTTGEISYTSFTGGYFATVVKVTAYKCNIKVAEIFREINVVLNNNCPTTGGQTNAPPVVTAPFFDPVTGLLTSYIDTVYAGDTVRFQFSATDFQTFNNGTPQTVTIEASGAQFGTNFTNPNAGCIITPCATLAPATPTALNPYQVAQGQFAAVTNFQWVTTCRHVEGLDTNCRRIVNTYNFVIKARDNYCPANANSIKTITIVIVRPPKLKAPILRCASVNTDGSVALSWNKSTPRDTQNTWYAYDVYASLNQAGPYQFVDSIKTGFLNAASYSYTQSAASLNALFGTNAQQQSIYYYLKTRSGCNGDSVSDSSNILRTIKLDAVLNGGNADLTWNALSTPPLSSHAGNKYMIHREFPAGTWTLIDSTFNLNYTDPFPLTQCQATIVYRVSLADSSGCTSWSSHDTVIVNNANPNVVIQPLSPVICQGSNVVLTCQTVGNTYLWSNGQTTQNITVTNTGNYTVTVTVAGGCSGTASTNVTVAAPPVPSITGTNVICAGGTTSFNAGAGYASYQWSGGLGNTQNVSPSTAGTYTVTVTDANGCTGTATRALTVNPNPAPTITGNNVICSGASTVFNAGAGYSNYQWSGGLGNTQNVSPTISGTYTVTVTDANGCTGTATRTLTINPNPVPNITGNNVYCAGGSTTFDAGAGYASYQWSGGLGNTQTISPTVAGTYTVTVTDANGCSGNTTRTLTINPNPVAVISGDFDACQGATATLNANGGMTNYQWTGGLATGTINPGTAGTYTVTITNANGCTGTASQVVTIYANPIPNITGTSTICAGNNTTLNAGNYTSYQWSGGLGSTQNVVVSVAGTYTVTVTDANGCTGTDSQLLTVNANPVPNITGNNVFCAGGTTSFDAGAGYAIYQWSGGLGNTQTVSPTVAGTYTVTVTDNNGCIGSGTRTLTINPNPVAVITGDFDACQGATATLTANAGMTNYQWTGGLATGTINPGTAGTYTVTITNANGCTGTASQSVTIYANPVPNITGINAICAGSNSTFNAGSYSAYLWSGGLGATQNVVVSVAGTYTVTVTDANGCTGTDSQILTVNANPVPNITGNNVFCAGGSTNFDAGAGYVSYQWSGGLGNTQTVSPTVAGTYTVTVTDINGCIGSGTRTLTINPNPVAIITGDFDACQGATATLTANAGMTNYQWTGGLATGTINPGTPGTYTVTITDGNGCTGTISQAVTIYANPVPTINGTFTVCQGFSATLTATAGYNNYQWSSGQNVNSISPAVGGTYTVTVTDANACTGSTSQPVVVNANPSPVIAGTTAICDGSTSTFDAGAGYAGYQWSGGLGSNQTITISTGGSYTVTVTDNNGCVGTASQSLNVNANPVAVISGDFDACQGATATLNANPGMTIYQWSSGQASATINPGAAGQFTVTITDGNGCTGSTFQDVTIHPNPIPTISGTFEVCQGFSATLNATAGFAGYSWNSGSAVSTINPTTNGNYTVTVTDINSCTGSATQFVTVYVNPTPVITGNNIICDGATTTFDAGSYSSFVWSNGSISQTINIAAAGNYVVTVTDINGCIGTTNQSLIVNPNPVALITGDFDACQGDVATLTANAGMTNYQWSGGLSTGTINPGIAGTYTVTITDANGCTGTSSQPVTIYANPVPAINGTFTVCQGFNASLNATNGYNNYLWSNGQNSNSISPNVGGLFTVTVTDANGCTGSVSELVVVNPNPVPIISGTTSICDGFTSTFDAGAGYAGYQWSGGLGSNQTITILSAGVYTVTVTDNNGCIGSTNETLTVNPNPVALITGDFDACQGDVATLTANAGMTNYQWSGGLSTGTITPGTAGLYTVTISDANGCIGTASQAVTIYQNPVPVITGNFTVCQGFAATLNASTGYPSYTWSSGESTANISPTTNGTYTVTVTDANSCIGSVSQIVVVNANPIPIITGNNIVCDGTTTTFDAGSYTSYVWSDGSGGQTITTGSAGTYTVTVTDGNGCIGTTSQTLTVNAIPTGSIFGDTEICIGQQTPIYFNFTGTAPFTFSYSDGTSTFGPLNSGGTTIDLTVNPTTTTNYTFVALNDANCQGTFVGSVDIVVNLLPTPTITGDLEICDGDSSTISASAGFVDYLWSNGTNTPDNTVTVGGNYSVTVTDLNGCQGTTAVNFTVNQTPVASFTHTPSSDCNTPRIFFSNTSTYPPLSQFNWVFGDGTSSTQTNPTHIFEEQGTYATELTITTTAGCVDTVINDVEVIFYPLAEADFKFDPEFVNVFNGKVQFTDVSQNAVSWSWDFGDGGSQTEQNPYHYFNEVGDFPVTLTVLNINGCPDSKTRMVMVNPFYVPNAFTPNGDGVNDFFFNAGYDLDVASFEMMIFNRLGQKVYVTDSWLKFWNGLDVDNKPAPEGVYTYTIRVVTRGGKEHVFHGTTALVR